MNQQESNRFLPTKAQPDTDRNNKQPEIKTKQPKKPTKSEPHNESNKKQQKSNRMPEEATSTKTSVGYYIT